MKATKNEILEVIAKSKNLSILYVEDNKGARESTLDLFLDFFGHVDVAVDGKDGLEKFHSNHYDLIITDINMPNMDGIEMIKQIRETDKEIYILVLSAYNESGHFTQTIRLGIEGYILKPIEMDQFIDILKKIVTKFTLKQQNLNYKQNLEKQVDEKSKELKEKNRLLFQRLYYDELTRLGNRNLLIKELKEIQNKTALMLIDINRFKDINDLYGVKNGDRVLREFANILKNIADREECLLFRLSGDEFVVLNKDSQDTYCKSIAQEIITTVKDKTFELDHNNQEIHIYLNITIGYAYETSHMLEKANLALNFAKNRKLTFKKYSNDLQLEHNIEENIKWTKIIKKAIKDNKVVPFFQPIFKDDDIVKYEALIRIIDDNGSVISPFFFLNIAKKNGDYKQLTKIMIEKSFKIFEQKSEKLSINLSFEDIIEKDIVSFLKSKIYQYKMANKPIVELVESESIDNFDLVNSFIQDMRKLGVMIAIDDFGSGYSNFSYLMEMKPDFIKIDGSIIKLIDTDKNSLLITQMISEFAKKLDIETIAEFIHNEAVYQKARELGVDEFQGFLLGEPMPIYG